jgi:ribosomal protein L16/L10AE
LEPNLPRKKKMMKGRPRVPTGGSTKGTTVVWGDYGLRMCDHHRRVSAAQLKTAEDTIKARLRGEKYRLYKRVACNVGVFISGNEVRCQSVLEACRNNCADGCWCKDENG